MMKKFLALICAGTMLAATTACGNSAANSAQSSAPSSGAASSAAAADHYDLNIVLKTTSSEYWQYVIAGAKAAEAELGNVSVTITGATSDTAFDEQQNMVETLIASGEPDAMAIAPLQAGQINTIIGETDIPILAVDTSFDSALTFIGTGNEDAAYQGGKYVADLLGEGGKVAVLANIQGEQTSESRVKGFTDALLAGGCEILCTQYTDGVADKAVTVMEGILQTYPEVEAVVCCADDVALGASRAIEQAGRADDGIIVCGFDGISSGVQAVVDGSIACTVAQDPYNMGYQSVMCMVDVLEGKTLDAFIDTGCNVITPENAEDYLARLDGMR